MYKRGFIIFGVVSLTMGNSAFPAGHRLSCDKDFLRKFSLRQSLLRPQVIKRLFCVHVYHLLTQTLPQTSHSLQATAGCGCFMPRRQPLRGYSVIHFLCCAVNPAKAHRFFHCIDVPKGLPIVHRTSALDHNPAFAFLIVIFR